MTHKHGLNKYEITKSRTLKWFVSLDHILDHILVILLLVGDVEHVQAGSNHVADEHEGQLTDVTLVEHIIDEYNHESPPPPENDICPKFGCLALKLKQIGLNIVDG